MDEIDQVRKETKSVLKMQSAVSISGSGDLMDEIDQVRKEEEKERLENERSAVSSSGSGDLMGDLMANLKRRRKGMAGNVLQVFLSDKYLLLQTFKLLKQSQLFKLFFSSHLLEPMFVVKQYTLNRKCQLKIIIIVKEERTSWGICAPSFYLGFDF